MCASSCRRILLALRLAVSLYSSFKGLEAANEEHAHVWLKYWTGLGAYLAADSGLALLFHGSQLIEYIRLGVLVWMLKMQEPQMFYDSYVGSLLLRVEPEIDYLAKKFVSTRRGSYRK
ncbi:uncharacterized protein LOC142795413 [Rhipicephalus microplus]|uniref:uncharacterized protein LOC142795413 n=1 Tax=Rhipicephalus microplus TaxID=6941 RepID=UPI0023768C2E